MAKMGRKPKYDWESKAVGEVFQMPGVKIQSARSMCSIANKVTGRHFSAKVRDGVIEVTRTA